MKDRSDTDIMIEALEEATLRADPNFNARKDWSQLRDLAIIADLIEAKHIRGDVLYKKDGVTTGRWDGRNNPSGTHLQRHPKEGTRRKKTADSATPSIVGRRRMDSGCCYCRYRGWGKSAL